MEWLDQVVDLLLGFSGSLRAVLIPEWRLSWKGRPYLQEDIQLLSDIVNCGNLGLGFFDEVILLLLELLPPLVESRYIRLRTGLGNGKE